MNIYIWVWKMFFLNKLMLLFSNDIKLFPSDSKYIYYVSKDFYFK